VRRSSAPLTRRRSTAPQIYLPGVNALLFVGVLGIMLTFRSSARLATAYGVSVTGALLIDTLLLLVVARVLWSWPPWKLALAAVAFGGVEMMFLLANLSKVVHGGWLPLLIALLVFTVMTTWQRGRQIVTNNRRAKEGSLREFVDDLNTRRLARVPGTAVFPHPGKETTPLGAARQRRAQPGRARERHHRLRERREHPPRRTRGAVDRR
jgi:KUP system potassium uptake protein